LGAASRQPAAALRLHCGCNVLVDACCSSLRSRGLRIVVRSSTLPHEKLIAYQAARQLLSLVREARISNPRIREQALNAASSACLNIAETTGRSGNADQKRVYALLSGLIR
jgi:hypothetical protein